MKQILMELIKKYYEMGMTVKDIMIIGQGQNQMVRMMVQRTSVAWRVDDDLGRPDEARTKEIVEMERKRIADQIYDLTVEGLKSIDKYDECKNIDKRRNIENAPHSVKVNWCVYHLTRKGIEILSFYDVMYLSSLESEGIQMGYKREAETHDNKKGEMMKQVSERINEFG